VNPAVERFDQPAQRPINNTTFNKETSRRKPMSPRSSILTLAAVAALAAAALAPSTASAAVNANHTNQASKVQRPASSPKVQKGLIGHDKITYSPQKKIGGDPNTWSPKKKIGGDPISWTPNNHWKHHHHHYWWWFAHHRQYWVSPVVTTTEVPVERVVSVPDTQTVAANCNCLTKEYLEDGSVLFKDLCTKEAAMATPAELKAQAQGAALQAR
jgi:hypothetical protein